MAKTERADVRLSKEHKSLFEQAAAIKGQPMATWMISTLLEEARKTLKQETVTHLSLRDMRQFLKLIDNPPKPNRKLRAAAKRFKERYEY